MKILHICRRFYPCVGGVENFVLCLAKEQVREGHAVSVLTLDRGFIDDARFASEEKHMGIFIRRIPFFGSKRYPIALSCIKYLNDNDIVHIHCVDFFVDYLVFLKPFHKKKIILHTHGGFFHTKKFRVFKNIFFNTITRMTLMGCDKVIACSENDYKIFSKISFNVVRIDNGVDIKRFSGVKKAIEPSTLLYVGRIDEHKRIDNLIQTLGVLRGKGQNAILKLLGPDHAELGPRLRELARRSGVEDRVLFLGRSSDDSLLDELSKAHIFVSASEYEGFGISVVEAMASGTLCVLNDITAFRNIIEAGRNGFIVDFGNSEEAAEKLIYALSLSPEEYSNIAGEAVSAAQIYSWDKVAVKIMKVYRDVAAAAPLNEHRRVSILGVLIDNVRFDEALYLIEEGVKKNANLLVTTPNVHHIMLLQKDKEFRKVYSESYLSFSDGMPIVWASKFLGTPLVQRISGSDLVPSICRMAAEKGYDLFFLGGRPHAAEKAIEKIKKKYRSLTVAGSYCPPFGFEDDKEENDKIVRMIKEAKPHILLVGLGAPKQEKWIYKHKGECGVPVSIGVGVTFEFIAGMVRRAPLWMQKGGLEWFWRLMMEPRRLWRRYLIDGMQFFWLVLKQKFSRQAGGK